MKLSAGHGDYACASPSREGAEVVGERCGIRLSFTAALWAVAHGECKCALDDKDCPYEGTCEAEISTPAAFEPLRTIRLRSVIQLGTIETGNYEHRSTFSVKRHFVRVSHGS